MGPADLAALVFHPFVVFRNPAGGAICPSPIDNAGWNRVKLNYQIGILTWTPQVIPERMVCEDLIGGAELPSRSCFAGQGAWFQVRSVQRCKIRFKAVI
ncbi:hypothetical protein ES705_40146 [subsurface metagenome]